ncbi:hypothetical protein WA026_001951 [Henosepilachna vigintioctopunctata]|uniref:Uncharacterized protein n=1 Tax=Henosepilachna vigintioctopunctata TaxID=420089 RepID=A0AAW1USE2_9CUCU
MCRGAERCSKCGQNHPIEKCETERALCIHCEGNHPSNDSKNCPEFANQKKIKEKMAYNNICYKEASTLVENSYASVVSTLPIHFGSSNKFTTNINKSPKRRLPDDSKLELKRKHSDIIKIIPSTSGNGVSLKQNFNEYNKENSTSLADFLDLSFLSEVEYNLLLSLLKECSGSMSNIGDISHKNVIKNKLQEFLNGKQT